MNAAKIIQLYEEMSEHTKGECKRCRIPHDCCSEMYCLLALAYAKEIWSTELEPTGHPRLPLMGESGCTAAPHLRPLCTVHTCDIMGFGFKRAPDDTPAAAEEARAWTKKYFELRNAISEQDDALRYLAETPLSIELEP